MLKRFIVILTAALVILATLPVFAPAPAQAWTHGTSGACPFVTDNGCAAAQANGSFKDVSLLTSAQQSGQISFLPSHTPQINIPGVDYGIGPDSTLSPQDPRTISDGVCVYVSVDTAVECFATSGTTVSRTINNYDFCGTKIGQSLVSLYISTGGPGSTILVTNNYFCPPNTANNKAIGFQGNFNVTIKNNQCDGANITLTVNVPGCLGDDGQAVGTTLDIEYNAFTHVNNTRVYNGGNSGASRIWKYNFIQGMNDINVLNVHGEVDLMSCGAGGSTNCANKTNPLFHAEGNFIIDNSLSVAYCASGGGAGGCTNSANWFLSAGAPHGIQYTAVNLINNVIVTNTQGAPGTPTSTHMWGQAVSGIGWASIGTLTHTGNWVDATGSTGCFVNGPASGSTNVTADASGNTINITVTSGSYNNNPIEPGWTLQHAGFTTATITAFGTGVGNLGTYTFSGSPQTLASTNGWTVVPNIGTVTSSGNFSLADPLNTGVPANMNVSGVTLASANCPGAHN